MTTKKQGFVRFSIFVKIYLQNVRKYSEKNRRSARRTSST